MQDNNNNNDVRLCKVCHFAAIHHGTDFCEACRSFYIRNQKYSNLPCKNDAHFKCLKLEGNESVKDYCILYKGGLNRRLLCPGCRLAKCKQIKTATNLSGNCSKRVQNRPATMEIEKSITPVDFSEYDTILGSVMKAGKELTRHLDKLPFRRSGFSCLNSQEAWCIFLSSLQEQIRGMTLYAENFDFYSNLSVQDRICLIHSSKQRIIVGENLLNPKDLYIGSMPSHLQKQISPYLASLETMREQAVKTKYYINGIGWTIEEFSFLLAFLYFDGMFETSVERNPENREEEGEV